MHPTDLDRLAHFRTSVFIHFTDIFLSQLKERFELELNDLSHICILTSSKIPFVNPKTMKFGPVLQLCDHILLEADWLIKEIELWRSKRDNFWSHKGLLSTP